MLDIETIIFLSNMGWVSSFGSHGLTPVLFWRPAVSRTFAFTPRLPARRTHPRTEAKYLHVPHTADSHPLRSTLPRQRAVNWASERTFFAIFGAFQKLD